jgi:hypothetical protein
MRGHPLGTSATTLSLIVAVASCHFPTGSRATSCDEDVELCPQSSKSATSVTCDCRCTIGFTEDTGQTFEGHVAVCLPPELNGAIAATAQQVALRAAPPRVFDQRVFQFCSRDVAGFLRSSIRMPGHLALGCASPVRCDCSTGGTQIDTEVCRSQCDDVACDARNCSSVVGRDSKVDLSSCFCTRATSCGSVTPSVDAPGLCRDWTRPPAITAASK